MKNKESFLTQVLKLSTSSVGAQLFAMLTMPIITKLYSVESFGIFGLYTSITTIITSIISLRMELAIMLPDEEFKAYKIIFFNIMFSLIFSMFWGVSFFVLLTLNLFGIRSFIPMNFIFVIPIHSFIWGLYNTFNFLNSRKKKFGKIGTSIMVERISSQVGMLTFGLLNFSNFIYLIVSKIFGRFVSLIILLQGSFNKNYIKEYFLLSNKNKFSIIKEYKNFPIYNTWSALLLNCSQNLPLIFISFLYGSTISGYFNLSRLMLNVPMLFIGQAISGVFFQKAVESNKSGNLGVLVESMVVMMAKYSLLPFLWLTLFGEEIFIFIFSKNWSTTGSFVEYQAVASFLMLLATPFFPVLSIKNYLKTGLLWNLFSFIFSTILIFLGYFLGNYDIAIIFYGLSNCINYLFLLIIIFKVAGLKIKVILQKIFLENYLLWLITLLFIFIEIIFSSKFNILLFLFVIIVYLMYCLFTDFKKNKKN